MFAMDSREIKVSFGMIKDLQVQFVAYPDISLSLDVVVDVPNAWGMLLSRR
jgi:hypothetical protein